MKFQGTKAGLFESVYAMVEVHDGMFDQTDENEQLIFKFRDADSKHDCYDAIASMNLTNVMLKKIDGLHISVSI